MDAPLPLEKLPLGQIAHVSFEMAVENAPGAQDRQTSPDVAPASWLDRYVPELHATQLVPWSPEWFENDPRGQRMQVHPPRLDT